MNANLIQNIKQNLGVKSTEELLDLWTENDREKWSVEYFEAVRLTLLERNEPLPERNHFKGPESVSRNQKLRCLARPLLLAGAGVYILFSLLILIMDVFWPAGPIVEILQQIRNALTLLCLFFAALVFALSFLLKEQ